MFSSSVRVLIVLVVSTFILWTTFSIPEQTLTTLSSHFQQTIQTAQLNPLFIESKLQRLVDQRKWNQIIQVSSKLLSLYDKYEGSFKFWYYRALSQCTLFQIKSCQQSWLNASIFAGEKYRSSIERMQEIFFLKIETPEYIVAKENNEQQNSLFV